jgi:DNA-binding NarL/FixJ family response regulator
MSQTATAQLGVLLMGEATLWRAALGATLRGLPDVRLLAEGAEAEAAVLASEGDADLAVVDCSSPAFDFAAAIARLRLGAPALPVLAVTESAAPARTRAILQAGATGVISRAAALDDLALALRATARGAVYASPDVLPGVLPAAPGTAAALSPREREVVRRVGAGESSREIARGLVISPKTVAQHKANIVRKLGLRGAQELTIFAARQPLAADGL